MTFLHFVYFSGDSTHLFCGMVHYGSYLHNNILSI